MLHYPDIHSDTKDSKLPEICNVSSMDDIKSCTDVKENIDVAEDDKSYKTSHEQKMPNILTAKKISIDDRHHELASNTSSLMDVAQSKNDRGGSPVELDNKEDENDIVMGRNIDALHESISNLRDEFLNR